jgi:hypothetical protein
MPTNKNSEVNVSPHPGARMTSRLSPLKLKTSAIPTNDKNDIRLHSQA